MPNVFVAYARQDEPEVDRLVEALERPAETFKIGVWYGRRDIRPGVDVRTALLSAIDEADVFLLCVSAGGAEGAMLSVEQERALQRSRSQPTFRILNVAFGDAEDVPARFRQFPIHRLDLKSPEFPALDALRERIVWGKW